MTPSSDKFYYNSEKNIPLTVLSISVIDDDWRLRDFFEEYFFIFPGELIISHTVHKNSEVSHSKLSIYLLPTVS